MISKLIRRSHMYLALFLTPWLLMYALSTMAMNHREALLDWYGPVNPPYEKESETTYQATFPPNADPGQMARQILGALGLDGAHTVNRRADGTLVIVRTDLLAQRRITFTPASSKLQVERMPTHPNGLLERFHRRRGYATGYGLDTTWAVTVDLVIVALGAWVLTGLWMWWEMKATRRAGAVAAATGIGLFALFLCLI
jgi:hypothetical protein